MPRAASTRHISDPRENHLLAVLPDPDFQRLLPFLEPVALLYELEMVRKEFRRLLPDLAGRNVPG